MQAWKTVSVGLLLVSVIAGCGQKGPLYREVPDETLADAVGESRNNDPDRRQDEDPSVR